VNCPACGAANDDEAASCFTCGRALGALTRGTKVAGRYVVEAVLGRGGMGTVYRVHDAVLDETVALKVLRPELAATESMERRFRSEIKLARRVTHPNVCRIHDYGRDGDVHYISMELVEGRDLRRRLDAEGPLPPAEACRVLAEAAAGLQAIHDVGIVHRDLKTANLMSDPAGRVRVMDFGIAAPTAGPVTPGSGYVVGSPEYMSPEQARGMALDARSDLYSLGVVFYELLAGHVPFRGDNPVSTVLQQLESAPDVSALPPALQPLVRQMLAKKAADRPASARAVVDALAGLGSSVPPGPGPTLVVPRARSPWPRAAVAALLGGALLATAWLVARPTPAPVLPSPITTLTAATPAPVETLPAPSPSLAPAAPSAAASPRVAAPPTAIPPPSPSPVSTPAPDALPTPTSVPATPAPTPAPASPSPEIGPGTLRVVVSPWADVTVDGVHAGQTPLTLRLSAGAHAVQLVHPDFRPYPRRVTIEPGQTVVLRVDLRTDGVRIR
jgi:serine/threonine protein kinase